MNKILKTLYLISLIFLSYYSNAQIFYYSGGKKIILEKDTSNIFIKSNLQKRGLIFINKLLKIDGVKSIDSSVNKDILSLQLKTTANRKLILSLLKSDPDVSYASIALKLDKLPYLLTGEILLQPKLNTTINDIVSKLNLKKNVLSIDSNNLNMYVLRIKNDEDVFGIANLLYESQLVDWSHPNFYVPITNFTIDPFWNDQYYLRNTGQYGGVAGIDINVEGAWNITRGNANIRIAVIDEGVEDHEDMQGRVLNGFTPRDVNGNGRPIATGAHGEATAGIIAATQDNSIGITGIAPLCQIVPINIFAGGETTLDIANAINWAWNQGQADVLSNSWGYLTSSQNQPGFDTIIQAVNNARTQGRNGRGSAVVFAAGNGGNTDVSFPGNIDNVITVGACNNIAPSGELWYYSQRGPSMDLVAPSGDVNLQGDVVTLDRMGNAGYETGNYTNRFGGTSAACPQVSGVIALMLSANPNLTENQVRTILQNTASDMGTTGFDNSFGFGRVNAALAVCQAIVPPSLIITSSNNDNSVCNTANYTVNAPVGSTVSWSIDAGLIASISPTTGTTTTLTKIANGRVTLTATISGGCSNGGIVTKKIGVGIPDLAQRFPRQNPRVAPIQYGYYNYATLYRIYTDPMPGSNQTWTVSTDDPYFSWGFGADNKLSFYFSNVDYTATFYGTETNACGSSYGYIYCKSVASGGGGGGTPLSTAPDQFTFSPNPTTGIAQISSINNTPFTQIRIFDKSGNLIKQYSYPTNTTSATINVSALIPDVYTIQVYFGNAMSAKQFIKQ